MSYIILQKMQIQKMKTSRKQESLNPLGFLRFINLKISYDKGVCIVVTLWSKYTNGLSTERAIGVPFRCIL